MNTPLRNRSLMSAAQDARRDVRLICNAVKRSTSLTTAAIVTGVDGEALVHAAERMTLNLLAEAGISDAQQREGHAAYAMVMEAVAMSIDAVAQNKRGGKMLVADVDQMADGISKILLKLIQSKPVAKIADAAWSGDIRESSALRLTIFSALTPLAVHMGEFCFELDRRKCLVEIAREVAAVTVDLEKRFAPADASADARRVLQQTIINSCSKVLTSLWERESARVQAQLRAAGPEKQAEMRKAMAARPMSDLIEALVRRTRATMSALLEASMTIVPMDDVAQQPAMQAPASQNAVAGEQSPKGAAPSGVRRV